jgi:HSP20 family protein
VTFLSEDKKKMNYYYGGQEKKASEIKKSKEQLAVSAPAAVERDFDRLMRSFQRDFEDFWDTSTRFGRGLSSKARASIAPLVESSEFMTPTMDLEDKGKMFQLTVDLPGFKKDDVQVELTDDSVVVNAKHSASEDQKGKNWVRHERSSQTFYRKIALPEEIISDQANAKLDNGVLEISLPKKVPKETKKLQIA